MWVLRFVLKVHKSRHMSPGANRMLRVVLRYIGTVLVQHPVLGYLPRYDCLAHHIFQLFQVWNGALLVPRLTKCSESCSGTSVQYWCSTLYRGIPPCATVLYIIYFNCFRFGTEHCECHSHTNPHLAPRCLYNGYICGTYMVHLVHVSLKFFNVAKYN